MSDPTTLRQLPVGSVFKFNLTSPTYRRSNLAIAQQALLGRPCVVASQHLDYGLTAVRAVTGGTSVIFLSHLPVVAVILNAPERNNEAHQDW